MEETENDLSVSSATNDCDTMNNQAKETSGSALKLVASPTAVLTDTPTAAPTVTPLPTTVEMDYSSIEKTVSAEAVRDEQDSSSYTESPSNIVNVHDAAIIVLDDTVDEDIQASRYSGDDDHMKDTGDSAVLGSESGFKPLDSEPHETASQEGAVGVSLMQPDEENVSQPDKENVAQPDEDKAQLDEDKAQLDEDKAQLDEATTQHNDEVLAQPDEETRAQPDEDTAQLDEDTAQLDEDTAQPEKDTAQPGEKKLDEEVCKVDYLFNFLCTSFDPASDKTTY